MISGLADKAPMSLLEWDTIEIDDTYLHSPPMG